MRRVYAPLWLAVLVGCSIPVGRPPVSEDGGVADGGATDGGSNGPCAAGFELVDGTCQDIDECGESPCDPNAHCQNTDGSFSCACNRGFTGDGFQCTSMTGTGSGVGEECDPSSNTQDCDSGLNCETMSSSGLGLCTKQCGGSQDCGVGSVCLSGYCLESCRPDMSTCQDPSFVCYTARSSGMPGGYCFESCVGQGANYCLPGTECNEMTGRCERFDCTDASDCGNNEVCASTPDGMLCVPDCRIRGVCPQGLTCEESSGVCRPGRP